MYFENELSSYLNLQASIPPNLLNKFIIPLENVDRNE